MGGGGDWAWRASVKFDFRVYNVSILGKTELFLIHVSNILINLISRVHQAVQPNCVAKTFDVLRPYFF